MPDISSIGHGSLEPLSRPSSSMAAQRNGTLVETKPDARLIDRVELSDHARLIDKMRHLPEGRLDLVNQVRQSIDSGDYETEEKMNLAISRLLDDIDS
ncbi:MAG: flagellar biosynthesis anti-sigma factor FlgM [Planctomycetota bacterium]|nr:flagellar biosynthesis anti-sigma factor FlgM [Planctomycetota bacterium]